MTNLYIKITFKITYVYLIETFKRFSVPVTSLHEKSFEASWVMLPLCSAHSMKLNQKYRV